MKAAYERGPRFWIGVASKDHVSKGVEGGFAQFCHGKLAPAKRIKKGDWVIYYSAKENFGGSTPLQTFTAIGRVVDDVPFQVEMSSTFKPFRRGIEFLPAIEVEIRPLLEKLDFVKDKKRWGIAFRYGFLEIDPRSFEVIARRMLEEPIRSKVMEDIK
jgi:predicted RNA-binding protein